MIRYLRYLFLAALGLVLITVALANRGDVTLALVPDEVASFLGFAPTLAMPLFLVIFASIIAGVLIGFIWEWLREHKHRAEATNERRERKRLEHEMAQLAGPKESREDDVLAILDQKSAAG